MPGSIFGSGKGYVRFAFGRGETSLIHEGIVRFADTLRRIQ